MGRKRNRGMKERCRSERSLLERIDLNILGHVERIAEEILTKRIGRKDVDGARGGEEVGRPL